MIPVPTVILRECRKCEWRGPLTGFVKNKKSRFGRDYACLPCHRKAARQRYIDKQDGKSVRYHRSPFGLPLALRASNIRLCPDVKECYVCGETKPIAEFTLTPTMLYGYSNECKKCHSQSGSARYFANPEPAKDRSKQWAKDNPCETKERLALWKAANPERYRELNRQHSMSRTALKKGITQEMFIPGGICEYCGSDGKMTGDHVIPITWKRDFDICGNVIGSVENMATACVSCNTSKNARLPDRPDFLERVADLLGYDPREKFEDKHFWEPPVLR